MKTSLLLFKERLDSAELSSGRCCIFWSLFGGVLVALRSLAGAMNPQEDLSGAHDQLGRFSDFRETDVVNRGFAE